LVVTKGHQLDEEGMKEQFGIDINDAGQLGFEGANNFDMLLTTDAAQKMQKSGFAKTVTLLLDTPEDPKYTEILFPYDAQHKWTLDDYGPV